MKHKEYRKNLIKSGISPYNIKKTQLPIIMQQQISLIEQALGVEFCYAEDHTNRNQGWALNFKFNVVYDHITKESAEKFLHQLYAHNPSTRMPEDDTSEFEEIDLYGRIGYWVIGLGNGAHTLHESKRIY